MSSKFLMLLLPRSRSRRLPLHLMRSGKHFRRLLLRRNSSRSWRKDIPAKFKGRPYKRCMKSICDEVHTFRNKGELVMRKWQLNKCRKPSPLSLGYVAKLVMRGNKSSKRRHPGYGVNDLVIRWNKRDECWQTYTVGARQTACCGWGVMCGETWDAERAGSCQACCGPSWWNGRWWAS